MAASIRQTDALLVEWGEKLFRRRRGLDEEGGSAAGTGRRLRGGMTPRAVRHAIQDVLRPGAAQVVVKITGGGKGAKAMAAHLRYISRQGKEESGGRGRTLEVTDERGEVREGAQAIKQLMEDWRTSGSWIPDDSHRREAFHIIYSMPVGTPAVALKESVEASAARLYAGHRYAMAMHLDQGAPHVHVMVRAERRDGVRLNPRKADLANWRATFARELQARGIDAVATRQVSRGVNRVQAHLWQVHAQQEGRLKRPVRKARTSERSQATQAEAMAAWRELARALAASPHDEDRQLAAQALSHFSRGQGASVVVGQPANPDGGQAASTRLSVDAADARRAFEADDQHRLSGGKQRSGPER